MTLPHSSRFNAGRTAAASGQDSQAAAMAAVILARASRWSSQETICDADGPVDWWHVAWERLGDLAFAQAWSPEESRAAWLRAEVLRICALDAVEWVGPFFRPKTDPLVGSIETAHIGLGITDVLELCPALFNAEELVTVHEAIRDKGLIPTRRWFDGFDGVSEHFNNHYAVHLNGLVAMALATGSLEDLEPLPEWLNVSASLFQQDSYAESVQYWGYASVHHSHLFELLHRTPLMNRDWLGLAATALPWVAHSVMFAQPESEWGDGKHFSLLNFSDSALTGRPPSDALLSFARYLKESNPITAGLARWLFDLTYADLEVAPNDVSSFGFFNQIGWRSIAHLAEAAEPVAPEKANLDLCRQFSFGTTIDRDRWVNPLTVLAVRNGHDGLSTISHRHRDEGSFILGHRNEVFFTDPGHCCYRLQAYQRAKESTEHSTWSFIDGAGQLLRQSEHLREYPLGKRVAPRTFKDVLPGTVNVYGADISDAYGNPIVRAKRTWISWLPHLVVIVDDIEADRPLSPETQFVLNNRDHRLRTDQMSGNRLLFERGDAAIQFAQLDSSTDGAPSGTAVLTRWTALHDVYSPRPNTAGQGKEGSGNVHVFRTAVPGRRHRAVYAIIADHSKHIEEWDVHLRDGTTLELTLPGGTETVLPLAAVLEDAHPPQGLKKAPTLSPPLPSPGPDTPGAIMNC